MPNLKKLDYYTSLAEDLVDNPDNVRQREIWEQIDHMDDCVVEIPQAIKDLDFVGEEAKFAVTLPHDIIAAVVRFIATRPPHISGYPRLPTPEEAELIDGVENVLRWHYMLLNRRGQMPVRLEMARYLTKYAACAVQTQYIPYEVKRKIGEENMYSPSEISQMKHYGDFNWIPENPQNVYPIWSANRSLKAILKVGVYSVYDMIEEYGEDNVRKILKQYYSDGVPDPDELRQEYVSKFDFMDAYCRVIWVVFTGASTTLDASGEASEIMREEHKLGFLPWVVQDFGQPLLKGVVDSGLYDHLALLRAIIASKALGQASDKDTVITTPNPDNPNIIDDENNPVPERIMQTGTTIQRLIPHQLDQQLLSVYNEFKQELADSSSARALVNIENFIGGNTPASSINMAQNTAQAQLGPVQIALETLHEQCLHQELLWLNLSKEPTIGIRMVGKGDTSMTAKGSQFMLAPMGTDISAPNGAAVDPDMVYIKVSLRPTYIMDKQASMNLAIIQQQAGVARKYALEEAGIENVELNDEQAIQEAYEKAFVADDIAKIQGATQLQLQQAGMQMQMQAQQEMAGGAQTSPEQQVRDMNGQAQFAASQGVNTRQGGTPPAQQAPEENRVSLNGMDDLGNKMV